MADLDTLRIRGIPFRALVDGAGVAVAGTDTIRDLADEGMSPICQVDGTGTGVVGGQTPATLLGRGIPVFCEVDQAGTDPINSLTLSQLRGRGIPGCCIVGLDGIAQGGSLTIAQLRERGIGAFCPVDENGTATTLSAARITLTGQSIAEFSANGTTVGTLATVNTTGTAAFTLADTAGGRFSLTGNLLKVADTTLIDYETSQFHSITVAVTGVTPSIANRTFIIVVTDVVEPVIALTGTTASEGATIGTTVGVLSILNSFTGSAVYALTDSAGGRFAISGSNLNTAAVLDYETATSHSITVSVSGITPAAANGTFTITVTDVTDPVIDLTGTTVNEDAAVNTVVGTLSLLNSYTGSPVYTLTDSAGGKFNISGTSLRVNAALDYETATTHSVTVAVSGITPAAANKAFTVVVLDVTEAAYTGPGDIKAGALGWWGLRAYSAAQCTGSVAAIRIMKASDGTAEQDINILANGRLDVATISALGYAVKVKTIYDQSGNGRHLTALTASYVYSNFALAPDLDLAGIGGTMPCLVFNGSQRQINTTGFGAVAQPFSISAVFSRATNNSQYESYFAPDVATFGLFGDTTANKVLLYTGGGVLAVATAADAAVHTGQFVFNNASSSLYVDGSSTAGDTGSSTSWPAGPIGLFNNENDGIGGKCAELGFWGSAFSGGDAASMNTNQQNYLAGIGGGGLTKNIVTDYSAVADGEWASATLSIANGGTTLTASTALWTSGTTPTGDVGKAIVIGQIGGGGNCLVTTITGVGGGGTTVTLALPAQSALSSTPGIIVCWGTNNADAFDAFRDAYQGQTVTLTVPAGVYCIAGRNPGIDDNFGGLWDGIRNITVNATGATICGGLFQIQASAQYADTTHHARTASVTAGASFVTLSTPSQVSRFTPGRYALMTGFDLQMSGYPTNQHIFEYLLVTAVDSDTGSPTYGKVTFATPLVNSYLSTWPHYNSIGTDYGGPATLYAMNPNFDHTSVVNGLTVVHHQQWAMAGKSLTFNDCVFHGAAGQSGPHPTMAIAVTMNNCVADGMTMEVDKEITTFTMNGCTWDGINIQSTSVDTMILDNTDIEFTVLGAVKTTIIRNGSTIGTLNTSTVYGYPNSLTVSDSTISNFGDPTYHRSGHEIRSGDGSGDGIQTDFSIEDGIITIPAAIRTLGGTSQWAVKAGRVHLYDQNVGSIGMFTITGVSESAPGGNILVATDMTLDDWPARTYSGLGLWLYTHAAPDCTFTSATGCTEAAMLSTFPAHTPLYSRYYRSFDAASVTTDFWQLYGRIKSVVVAVTTPYVGATATARATLSFGNATVKMSDYSDVIWNPVIDLKTSGTRTFDTVADPYPTAWTGSVGADALTGMTEAQWATSNFRVIVDAFAAGTGPVFTVEVITDQGF